MALKPSLATGRGSSRTLLYLGVASAAVYLLALSLPYWLPTCGLKPRDEIYAVAAAQPWRGILFYAALAVLFGLYAAALCLVTRADPQRPMAGVVGLCALAFCLILIPAWPLTSSDVYGYVFQGRIVAVLGENPFVHLNGDFAADPFYFCVTFRNQPASYGYGPLWIAIEAVLGWLARDRLMLNLVLFKGLAAGLHLLSTVLVYGTLSRVAPQWRVAGMLLYAWNPLLLYELVGNGHNDAAVAVLVLFGLYLASRDRGLLAVPVLSAAALVKPVALLWLPLVVVWLVAQRAGWPGRLKQAVVLCAVALLSVAIGFAPFWGGTNTFQGLQAQSNVHGNSLPNVLIVAMSSVWPGAKEQIVDGVKAITGLALATFFVWQLWLVWHASRNTFREKGTREDSGWRGLVRCGFDVNLFFLLFVGLQFWPWYLTWSMVPAALLDPHRFHFRRLFAIAACAMAPLLYFPFGWQWARRNLPLWAVALVAALPMSVLLVWLAVKARHEGQPQEAIS
jgi:alpha-1,6-mannosyltransferase